VSKVDSISTVTTKIPPYRIVENTQRYERWNGCPIHPRGTKYIPIVYWLRTLASQAGKRGFKSPWVYQYKGNCMKPDVSKKFFTKTDDTGRFMVTSARTGKTYAVEPIGDPHVNWGSVDPADAGQKGKLMHKKGDGKYRGSIDEDQSLITEANGFTNIQMLDPGTSPFAAIEALDAKYPDKV
jgi:hypothetical protein